MIYVLLTITNIVFAIVAIALYIKYFKLRTELQNATTSIQSIITYLHKQEEQRNRMHQQLIKQSLLSYPVTVGEA